MPQKHVALLDPSRMPPSEPTAVRTARFCLQAPPMPHRSRPARQIPPPPPPVREKPAAAGADAIMGVAFFADQAPDIFGTFSRAFVTLYCTCAGAFACSPAARPDVKQKDSNAVKRAMGASVWRGEQLRGHTLGVAPGGGAASGQVVGGAACLVQGLRFPHHIATAVSHARSLVRPLGRTVIM